MSNITCSTPDCGNDCEITFCAVCSLAQYEAAYKKGHDAGIEFQKTAAPTPKAKQYRDALRESVEALRQAAATFEAEGAPRTAQRFYDVAAKASAVLK